MILDILSDNYRSFYSACGYWSLSAKKEGRGGQIILKIQLPPSGDGYCFKKVSNVHTTQNTLQSVPFLVHITEMLKKSSPHRETLQSMIPSLEKWRTLVPILQALLMEISIQRLSKKLLNLNYLQSISNSDNKAEHSEQKNKNKKTTCQTCEK